MRQVSLLILGLGLGAGPVAAQDPDDEYAQVENAYHAGVTACMDADEPLAACRDRLDRMCIEGGSLGATTLGLTMCGTIGASAWDGELNRLWPIVLDHLVAEAREPMRVEQRAWIAYRDAACAREVASYPGGSMQRYVGQYCLMAMTSDRVQDFRDLVEGEGN